MSYTRLYASEGVVYCDAQNRLAWHALCTHAKGDSSQDRALAGPIFAANKIDLHMFTEKTHISKEVTLLPVKSIGDPLAMGKAD